MDDDFPEDQEVGKVDVRSTVERLELFNAVRFKVPTPFLPLVLSKVLSCWVFL
jgi:hypothetical protein